MLDLRHVFATAICLWVVWCAQGNCLVSLTFTFFQLGNGLRYPKPPVTEREPTFLLCVLLVVRALPLPRDAFRMLAADPTCQHPSHTPRPCPSHASLAHPGSRPHPLVVRPAYSPLATPDRHWIDAFPLTAKSTCLSYPKTIGPGSSIASVALTNINTQDTAALRSTHRALSLAIAPRGLDLVLV